MGGLVEQGFDIELQRFGPSAVPQNGVELHERPNTHQGAGMLHVRYLDHFSAPLYDTDEVGPLCTDDGGDLLSIWEDRRNELSPISTVRDILVVAASSPDKVDELIRELEADGGPDASEALISAGFVLIGLTGQIDDLGRSWVIGALQRSQAFYGSGAPWYQKILGDLDFPVRAEPRLDPADRNGS